MNGLRYRLYSCRLGSLRIFRDQFFITAQFRFLTYEQKTCNLQLQPRLAYVAHSLLVRLTSLFTFFLTLFLCLSLSLSCLSVPLSPLFISSISHPSSSIETSCQFLCSRSNTWVHVHCVQRLCSGFKHKACIRVVGLVILTRMGSGAETGWVHQPILNSFFFHIPKPVLEDLSKSFRPLRLRIRITRLLFCHSSLPSWSCIQYFVLSVVYSLWHPLVLAECLMTLCHNRDD